MILTHPNLFEKYISLDVLYFSVCQDKASLERRAKIEVELREKETNIETKLERNKELIDFYSRNFQNERLGDFLNKL